MYEKLIEKYSQQKLNTDRKEKLIILLYEEMDRLLEEILGNLHYSTYDLVNKNFQKINDIILELYKSLDLKQGGDIAKQLSDIYLYLIKRIQNANYKKDKDIILEIKKIINDLLVGWRGVYKQNVSLNKEQKNNDNQSFNIEI